MPYTHLTVFLSMPGIQYHDLVWQDAIANNVIARNQLTEVP